MFGLDITTALLIGVSISFYMFASTAMTECAMHMTGIGILSMLTYLYKNTKNRDRFLSVKQVDLMLWSILYGTIMYAGLYYGLRMQGMRFDKNAVALVLEQIMRNVPLRA